MRGMVSRLQAARDLDARRRGAVNPAGPSAAEQTEVLCHGNPGTASARREMGRPRQRRDYELLETAQRPKEDSERTPSEREGKTPASPRARSCQPAVTNAPPFAVTPTRRPHPLPGGGRCAALRSRSSQSRSSSHKRWRKEFFTVLTFRRLTEGTLISRVRLA